MFACDASPDAPALQIADKGFVVPPADADNYLDVLLTICREQRVRLLIPAVEPELPLLAAHRARFLEIGTLPLVSSPEIVAICYDKLETATFLDRCGLAAPRTYVQLEAAREALSRGEITFPLVVKPRWGVSSIGLAIAEDDQELDFAFKMAEKQIARSFLAQASAAASGTLRFDPGTAFRRRIRSRHRQRSKRSPRLHLRETKAQNARRADRPRRDCKGRKDSKSLAN